MKPAFLLATFLALGLGLELRGQTPAVSPESSPVPTATIAATTPTAIPTASPSATISPTASPLVSPSTAATASANPLADRIKDRVDRKFKHKGGFNINIGDDDADNSSADRHHGGGDIPEAVVGVVGLVMLAVFGAPVAIVLVIMLVSWARTRSLHRTVRSIVESGQPVPPELLASRMGAPLRPWYDLRRGIILLAVGIGIIFFFGVSAGWDAGVWALGLIPAIMGGGYIVAWRLARKQDNGLKV